MPPQRGQKYRPRRSKELKEMLLIERQKPEQDSEHQKKLRSWYDADIKSWTARKDRLAAQERGESPPGESGQAVAWDGEGLCPSCHRPGPDRGTQRAGEDLKAWLERNQEL